ncbi:MAG: response regulator [Ferruginibacter sp.]|nr:response regulator [Ferruginibacter sp.]
MPKEKTDKNPVKSANLFPVVGIGASAGGLDAFKKLLKAIPENSGMAYILVQHLDPSRESMLPEILQKVTKITVSEITDDIKVAPDHIYIIPSNKMLLATDGILQLSPRPAKDKKELNLPIDLFFTSLAEVHQTEAIGVVLSGTASDGTRGLKAIKDHGGITFAQDEASAQYDGMPHSAAMAGVVDFILPPHEIPPKLIEIFGRINLSDDDLRNFPILEDEIFKQILALLRIRKGTDFTYYKQTTIRRRILRRMALNKKDEPGAYLKFLREHKTEQDILYQDLLIPVTSFFRDHKSFDNLCETVFPAIVKNKTPLEPIRVWVAGCSTGEEAVSIAICLKEYLSSRRANSQPEDQKLNNDIRVQIFATDISEPAIAKARRGVYSKADIDGLSREQLQEYFVKINGSYQVNKIIRDMCVYAVHNFLKDPPFAKMDLVTCRNVLIYMEPYLQKKALTTFHYALNSNGYLLLGKSETSGSVPDLFDNRGKNDKLFSRKDMPSRYLLVAGPRIEQNFPTIDNNLKTESKLADFQKTADDILLSKFTPAGVVVNEAMDIVHFRGASGAYLEPSPGKASFNLLKMIREGLAFELRNILHKAKTEKEPVVKENILIDINGVQRNVTIEAIPLRNVIEPHYLVLFHDTKISSGNKLKTASRKSSKSSMDEKDLRILQLEKELSQTREDMHTITEDQEAANEELQSANEELLSGSEELQSLNEEMETSKEELQSTNEELIVINQEMISLNEQVTEARNYAEAIVTTIKQPLIILDKNLRVKSANQSFYRNFMVSESETEGRQLFELGNRQWDIPELRTMLVNIIPDKERFSDYEVTQSFPNIGQRIMLLNAREMKEEAGNEKLILLAIEDITEKRVAEGKLIESEKKFRNLADFIPQIIWTAQPDGNLDYYNRQWYSFTGFDEGQVDQGWIPLLHEEDRQRGIAAWYQSVKTGEPYQVEYRFKDQQTGGFRWFLAKASPIEDQDGRITKWFGSFTDIHEQKIAEDELLKAKDLAELSAKTAGEAVRSKQQFLSNMSHEIRTPMNSIIGFTRVLLRTPITDQQREYLNAIQISGDVLIVLINDILDLAKVDAGKMTFEKIPFKLADTVSSMLHLFEIKMQEKNIELITQFDPLIPEVLSGDPLRLHQVILNLMSNAVKFTNKGKITVGVRMLSEDEEKVEIECSIADTGIGIPEDKLHLIFDNFQQAYTDSTRIFGGTGLGLSIVKKLVEAQGGMIQVKSKLKFGSVFTFTLSFQKTNEKPALLLAGEFVPETDIKNINVLVVEDMPLNQLLMKTLLADFGFTFKIVDNGKMAIEQLINPSPNPEANYDIILMDLQMPGMNGFEATEYIRNELHLAIPIIALTAGITQEDVQKCIEVGMNDYISKPVDEKLLFTKIIHLLKTPLEADENNILDEKKAVNITGKYTDLTYLKQRTKADTKLTKEMILIYLAQTPPLISAMKESIAKKDWPLLKAAAHKIHPSFAIMGMDKEFQGMAKKIQDYTGNPEQLDDITEMVVKIETVCKKAYIELEEELSIMNTQ